MHKNLEKYLEEIGHYLSGRGERQEILAEIRSHILEKATQEAGAVSEAALDKVIAAFGPARRVAEKYLGDRPLIVPAFKRHLFRYTTLLFAVHTLLTVIAVAFKKSFVLFPFIFMPRLGVIDALMYLPAAFLTDFGVVAMVLYFITQSGREFRLPWPRVGLDEIKPAAPRALAGRIAMLSAALVLLALTGAAVKIYLKFQTIFAVSFDPKKFRPLFMPQPGRLISLAVILMLATGALNLLVKTFTASRRARCWVDIASDTVLLVLIGLLLRQQYTTLFAVDIPAAYLPKIHLAATITLLIIALLVAIDLAANLVRLGRRRLAKPSS